MKFLGLAHRSLKETYRDPLALLYLLAFPLVFMLLFGAIFTGGSSSRFSVGVIDNDKTPLSQVFTDNALAAVSVLEIEHYNNADTAQKDLAFGKLDAYLAIPRGFGQQVSYNWQGEKADITLQMTYDESSILISEQLVSILNAVTRSFARIEIPIAIHANPIHIDIEINAFDYMGPGIIIFGLLILIPMAVLPIVRDRERGFLSRLLTTPTRPLDFIVGNALSLLAITVAQIIIFMVVARVLGMDIIGNLWLALLIFLLAGLCSIGIGMVIASLSKTEHQAMPLSWAFAMPLATLSGCWFPAEVSLPVYLRGIADTFPYAHALDAARAVMIRGVGLQVVGSDLLFLGGWTVLIFFIGVVLFRRSMRS